MRPVMGNNMKQQVLKTIPRPIKDMANDFLNSEFKWRYIDNLSPLIKFKTHPPKLNEEEKRILESLNQDGFATSHVSKLFPSEDWENLKEEYFRLEKKYAEQIEQCRQEVGSNTKRKNFLYSFITQSGDLKRQNIEAHNPMVKMASNPGLKKIADSYFGLFTQLYYYDFWLTFASPTSETRSQLWHRDVEDKMLLKGFIYLEDVELGQGPFIYARDTHLKGRNKKDPEWFYEPRCGQRRANDESMKNVCEEEDIIPLTGKAGDVIFADTRGLHKGGIARTADRKLFKFEFSSQLLEPI